MEKRCYECMEIIGEDKVCPNCGYDNNITIQYGDNELLKDRYFVGNVFSKTVDTTVYIAYDEALGKKVFVREFTGESIAKISNKYTAAELRQKFLNYAKGTATLNMSKLFPHTVDAFADKEKCYLVTDYFEGESLKTLLASGVKISDSNALKMTKQLLKRLEPLHNSGFVFGSISPETLYILKNGEVRVFGIISRFYDFLDDIDCRVEVLNPSYAAPELFEENAKIGPYCDVYSVSAILYRVLTNKIPAISFLRHGGENLVPPKKLNKKTPKNLQKALLNAMNWQTEKRTFSASEFLDELSSKKVKRVRSGAIIWANILGFFQRVYDKFAGNSEDEDRKRGFIWFWIIIPVTLFAIFVAVMFFLFPEANPFSGSDDSLSTSSAQSDDGWYYGNGVETYVSSNNYFYGGYSSEKNASSKEQNSGRNSSIVSDPNAVECPDLLGYSLDQAKRILEQNGLVLGKVTYKPSNDYAKDSVMAQSLKSGGMIQKGTKIDVIVCSGASSVQLPKVSGASMQQAKQRLANAGYTNIEFVFVSSGQAPGTAIDAYFADSTKTSKSDKVIISVSGEKIGDVANYCGRTVADAKAMSPNIRFDFIGEGDMDISSLSDFELQTCMVVAQDFEPNTPAYKGMTITLTIKR